VTNILIVEDEPLIAENLASNLRGEGFTVSHVGNGEKALEIIRSEMPDLVMLDIMLPGLDGLSLCRMLRNDPTTSHIPVIMLTARGAEVDKIVGLENGADDYIVKPFSVGELLARVRAVLRRLDRPSAQMTELVAADLSMNLTGRRVFKGDLEVKLSNKEFDLLAELIRHRGVVLSRDLILTKVWGYDYFVDKRTVDVHIRWLREKVEDDASDPRRIITVRGLGYRFEG
jgi:DNA-binding response OmpR family regulator